MSGDGKSVRTLFRAKLDWSWRPDAGPRLISSGLPADHDHLMRPHPQAATTRRSMRALAARISRKMRVIGLRFVRNGQSESLVTDHAEPPSRSSTTLSLGEKDPMEVDSLGRPLAGRTTRGQVSLPREEGGLFAGGAASMFRFPRYLPVVEQWVIGNGSRARKHRPWSPAD